MNSAVRAFVTFSSLMLLFGATGCDSSTILPGWVDRVQTAWTVGWPENWNADALNDGLRIWVELQDSNETMIEYTGMSMPLQIELYSTESVTYPLEKSRLIYSGSGTLTDWDHDCFCTGAIGVKDIPWRDISSPLPDEDQDNGILYITVTLPNGKNFTAEHSPIQIRNK